MNFYFGENYYTGGAASFGEEVLVSFLGAFFGFGFALYLYYRNLQADKNDRLIYFQLLLEGSISHIQGLFKKVNAYVVNQRKDYLDLQIIKFGINNDISRLDKQDSQGIYLAYRHFFSSEEQWISNYGKIYKSIDLVAGIEEEIKRLYMRNSTDSYSRAFKIKEVIEKIPNRLAAYSLNIANELKEERYNNEDFQFLEGKIHEFQDLLEKNKPLSYFGDVYVKSLLTELLANHRDKIYTQELLFMGKNARTMIDDLRRDIEYSLKEMEKIPGESENIIERMLAESAKIKSAVRI